MTKRRRKLLLIATLAISGSLLSTNATNLRGETIKKPIQEGECALIMYTGDNWSAQYHLTLYPAIMGLQDEYIGMNAVKIAVWIGRYGVYPFEAPFTGGLLIDSLDSNDMELRITDGPCPNIPWPTPWEEVIQ